MYISIILQSITYEDWGPFFWAILSYFQGYFEIMLAVLVLGAVFGFIRR